MAAPTRYNGVAFSASGFSSTAGGTVDIGNDPDTVIIIHGGENVAGATTIVGATVNGVSATLVNSGTRPSVGGDLGTFVITSDDGAIGSGNVTVTLTMNNGDKRPGCFVEVWHGCTGTPRYTVGTAQSLASGSSSKSAGPYSSNVDSIIFVAVSTESGVTITATSPTTKGASTNGSQATECALYKSGDTSVTLNWTHNFTVGNYIVPIQLHGVTDPLAPPDGITTISSAIGASSTTATITYSYDASDETGFEYRLDSGSWTSIGVSPATITSLAAATEYSIEVRAINGIGNGTASSPITFGTWNPFSGGTEIGNVGVTSGEAAGKIGVAIGVGFS